MTRVLAALIILVGVVLPAGSSMKERAALAEITLRTRVEPFKGSGDWKEVSVKERIDPKTSAIVICDMWDQHWCAGATRRCGEIAGRMAPVVEAARASGMAIIHAPSDCMATYEGTEQRKRMKELPRAEPPAVKEIPEPPLPIDDSDGGCDDVPQCKNYRAWKGEHPAIRIAPEDGISDNGAEVYSLLKQRGIKTLFVMGVHTNMCVLGRSFAIRQMSRWGVRCVLVRDLTDTMYNPRMRPFKKHEEGTALVIEHIEKYWCPTVLAADIARMR